MNLSVNNAFNVAGFRSKKREKILAVAHWRPGLATNGATESSGVLVGGSSVSFLRSRCSFSVKKSKRPQEISLADGKGRHFAGEKPWGMLHSTPKLVSSVSINPWIVQINITS